jgi:transcriptional regulator with XRE-family HTH domain
MPVARKSDGIDRHVGERVRMRRIMLKMSQGELGGKIGVTFQQLQKYEKGTNRIGASRLFQLSQVLDVPPGFFFEDLPGAKGRGGNAMPDYLVDVMNTALGQRIVRAISRIQDTKMRSNFAQLIEGVAGEQAEPKPRRKGSGWR